MIYTYSYSIFFFSQDDSIKLFLTRHTKKINEKITKKTESNQKKKIYIRASSIVPQHTFGGSCFVVVVILFSFLQSNSIFFFYDSVFQQLFFLGKYNNIVFCCPRHKFVTHSLSKLKCIR